MDEYLNRLLDPRFMRVLSRGKSFWIRAVLLLSSIGMFVFSPVVQAGGGGGLAGRHWYVEHISAMPDWALPASFLILLGVYGLIIFELIDRALAAVVGGIVAVFTLHIIAAGDPNTTGPDLLDVVVWIDMETVGLLMGMMIIVGVLSETGIFQWAAVEAYARSGGSIWRLMVILAVVTAVFSAFLDNVTTMLLIAPVTIQLAKVLNLNPIPLLVGEVMFSNIGGTATQIGDPPNIIIGAQLSRTSLAGTPLAQESIAFIDFVINLAPAVFLVFLPSLWLLHRLEREGLDLHRDRDIESLRETYGVKDKSLLIKSGIILSLVLIAFFAHSAVDHPLSNVAVISLIGAFVMLLVCTPHEIEHYLDEVEWTTLLFFAGLFILIGGLSAMGLIDALAEWTSSMIAKAPEDHRLFVALMLLLWVSAIASAFIDNIPFTATMVPVMLEIAQDVDLDLPLGPLAWALALGACLGGNGTLIGASANVATAGIASGAGHNITFMRFFKTGFPIMIVSVILASVYLYIMFVMWEIHETPSAIPYIVVGIGVLGMVMIGRIWGPSDITIVEEE